MSDRRFGVSTHLFHDTRLSREQLVEVAAHGFEAVELVATRSHFDYTNDAAVADLRAWLSDTGLTLHSVHAPVAEARQGGQWVNPLSTAAGDETRRRAAVAQVLSVLALGPKLPYRDLVVHLGVSATQAGAAGDNARDAARRSAQEIVEAADGTGIRVAFEVMPNALATPDALVHLLEEELEGTDAGICLDYGHAHLGGDLCDAIETVSGHVVAVHLHDNDGRRDAHRVPGAGTIDWPAAMMETQKIGYDGILMFEIADPGDPVGALVRAARARTRLEETFITF